MHKKITLTLLTLGAIGLIAVVVLYAEQRRVQQPIVIDSLDQNNPEVHKLLELLREAKTDEEKQEILKGLEALELEKERTRGQNLSEEEKQRIMQEKQRSHEQRLREMQAGVTTPSVQPVQCQFVGIIEGDQVPSEFRPWELTVLNFWGGEIDKQCMGVYAGYQRADPHQGMVVDDESPTNLHFYPTPTSTGPVRTIAETNGVLTLKSVGGMFEMYNDNSGERKNVYVPGGVTYHFDVRTRTYR